MEVGRLAKLCPAIVALALATSVAFAQAPVRPPYGVAVNLETAKKIATAAMAEAKKQKWNVATPETWDAESARFFSALTRLDEYLATDRPLGCKPEKLLQGPVADGLTHVGQIMMLRRLASAPVRSENYAIAEIVPGRVTAEQAAPRFEFD